MAGSRCYTRGDTIPAMTREFDEQDDHQSSAQPASAAISAARLNSRGRASLGWLAVAGSLLVASSEFMQRWAQAHGVHCLECDRPADMAFWTTYFNIKLILLGLGAFLGLLAALAGRGALPRLGGVVVVLMSLFVLMTTPK